MKSGCKQTDVKRKVHQAMRCLMKNDRDLMSVDANERSLTHRLAVYLEQVFPDYHVDCEYNRNHESPKRLKTFQKIVSSNDLDGTTVYPDIIVHQRGTDTNFIVFEAKKSSLRSQCCISSDTSDSENCSCDRCKLSAYKTDLNYAFAFLLLSLLATQHALRLRS